jgi:endonuclease/exonuclease/phosphatase family metal-dependent hydrolase
VLVRGELSDLEVLPLPGAGEPRVALLARAPGASVAVCHLGLGGVAELQLPVVAAALADRPPPRVLLGDLNLTAPVVDGLRLVGRGGPTCPAGQPRARIDHVALGGLEPRAVVVPMVPVSDHRPLVVEV